MHLSLTTSISAKYMFLSFCQVFQCKFVVMADKNIFVDKPFLSLNISDLPATTPQKVHPSFPATPSRNRDHVKPPPFPIFSNFGRRCNPSEQKGGRG